MMERAEQCTVKKSFTGSYQEMLNRWVVYPRGTLVVDSGNNFFRVLNTTLTHLAQKGDVGQLDLTMEALSFDSPPDEFSCRTVNLGLDIMKNPRYFYALMPTSQIPKPWPPGIIADTPEQEAAKLAIVRTIQAYRENPIAPTKDSLNNIVNSLMGDSHDKIHANFATGKFNATRPNPNYDPAYITTPTPPVGSIWLPAPGQPYPAHASDTKNNPAKYNPVNYIVAVNVGVLDPYGKVALALAAGQELIGKLWRMEDSPPVYGLEITWTEYYWRPPYINLGSYIENPQRATPPLPDYFTCPATIPNGSTIFDMIAHYNPQYYSESGYQGGAVSISWLRQADDIEFQRTFFKVTRKWLGAPTGAWDIDLFNQKNRPSTVLEYKPIGLS